MGTHEKIKGDFFDLLPVKTAAEEFGAHIIMIFGQRSNGKTFSVKKEVIERFKKNKEKFVYVRRWDKDLSETYLKTFFDDQTEKCRYWHHEFLYEGERFGISTALSQNEHFKGITMTEDYTTIFFDECFTAAGELPGEFDLWQGIISSVTRNRDNVTIYMIGNTVRRVSTYFERYQIDVRKLKRGEINLITIKQRTGEIKIAAQWVMNSGETKNTRNLYFVDATAGGDMLSDGDFASEAFRTGGIDGVTIKDWERARKLPISLRFGETDFELRFYNGILLIKPGRPSLYVVGARGSWKNDGRRYRDSFPTTEIRQGIAALSLNIQQMIKERMFVPDSDETGAYVCEIVGA